ncbi:MAG: alpha/beta hydrolase [Prosthecobacter sp.]
MTEHTIQSSSGFYQRTAWLLDPPTTDPTRCAIFLDGEFYVHRMGAPALVHDMQASGRLPPTLCVFVSHERHERRHHDLTCSTDFARFIAQDVITWLRARHPTLAGDGHLIAGPSLGGLQAAFITLTHAGLFSRCLSQSGSFWWEDEKLTSMLDTMPPSHSKFWISVGDRETKSDVKHTPSSLHQKVSQIDGCERFAAALVTHHHEVHYSVHAGAHEFQPWADELPQALAWLAAGASYK